MAQLRSFGFLLSLVIISSLLVHSSFAEPRNGRLPNGQAYRTDAAGNQIVDYIAELEVKNEALERRIRGLVAEVDDLRSASRAGISQQGLKEKNLLNDSSSNVKSKTHYSSKQGSFAPVAAIPESQTSKNVPEVCAPATVAPSKTCGEQECEIFITEVRTRGERALQKQTADLKNQTAELRAAKEKVKTCDEQFEAYKVAAAAEGSREAELVKELNQVKLKSSAREDLLTQRQSEISRKDSELTRKEDEVRSLQGKVRTLEAEVSRLQTEASSVRTVSEVRTPAPVAAAAPASVKAKEAKPTSVSTSATRASLSSRAISQSDGISSAKRASVKGLYSSVIKMRNQRDKLFAAYNSSTLSIKKSRIRSKSGKLPEQLLGTVKSTNNPRELYLLEREGKRLEKMVKSDIALINRMKG